MRPQRLEPPWASDWTSPWCTLKSSQGIWGTGPGTSLQPVENKVRGHEEHRGSTVRWRKGCIHYLDQQWDVANLKEEKKKERKKLPQGCGSAPSQCLGVLEKWLSYEVPVLRKQLPYRVPVLGKWLSYRVPVLVKWLPYWLPVLGKWLLYWVPVLGKW